MKRRDFLKWIFKTTIGVWILGFIGSIFSFIKFPKLEKEEFEEEIEIKGYENLKIGEAKFIPHLKEPLFLIKIEKGFVAVSAVCTHMKCILKYNFENKRIDCPCHGAAFDLNGNSLFGPPKIPLKRYEVKEGAGKLYVVLK